MSRDTDNGHTSGNGRSVAPWTSEQVRKLNDWQRAENVHPFTCPGGPDHGNHSRNLVAYESGWQCPFCGYEQNWAHEFMMHGPPPTIEELRATWLTF